MATTWDELKAQLEAEIGGPLEETQTYVDEMRRLRDGDMLRAAREGAGLTQVELARRLGTSQSHVARIEAGLTTPTLATVERIADATGAAFAIRHDELWQGGPATTGIALAAEDGAEVLDGLRRTKPRTAARAASAAPARKETEVLVGSQGAGGEPSDLTRVKGIGQEYAVLLEAAGVGTVRDLRRRNAVNLRKAIVRVNAATRIVKRLPTESMVASWVERAGGLDASA